MGPSVNEIQKASHHEQHSVGFRDGGRLDHYSLNGPGYHTSGRNQEAAHALRDRTRSRSRSPTEKFMDIQVDDDRYTEIFSWGADYCGQLGLGIPLMGDQTYTFPKFCSYNISIRLVACGTSHTCFVTHSDYLYSMGDNTHGQLGIDDPVRVKNSPVLIEGIPVRHVSQIACGGNQSMLCSEDGSVYSWGEGQHGALGLGTLQD